MIQILGYRPYLHKKSGKIKTSEKFFERNWRAESVSKLFLNIEEHLKDIPEDMRWNLHYTLADCHEEPGRKFRQQDVIPFDIDNISTTRVEEYIPLVCEAIGVRRTEVGIVESGNGLHFLVGLSEPFTDVKYFKDKRPYYNAICERINRELKEADLPGDTDDQVFAPAHTLRLPETTNNKTPETGYPKKNRIVPCKLIQRVIVPLEYDLALISGIPTVADDEQIDLTELKKYPNPDTPYILQECKFLKDCKQFPNAVNEENWYKMLSITARLSDGVKLSHQYSQGHDSYDEVDTDLKIQQAIESSGPRTCDNIGRSYNCTACPHYKKTISPITLKGPDYISTKKNGFREFKLNANGLPVKGPVAHDDLEKFFRKKNTYISTQDKSVHVFKETHWEALPDVELDAFCEKHVEPSPRNMDCSEFRSKIQRRNLKDTNFFEKTTFRKINLSNGVLDLSSGKPELTEHDKNIGFLSCLPYSYDPKAQCPRFDKFMKEITLDRQDLIDVLLEYAGYSFANESCVYAKSLILIGEGSNGKSTFMEVLQSLAGDSAYSSIPLTKFQDEKYLATLQGKLFNLTEETPSKAFMDSSVFKNIVSGGPVTVRHLYKQPFTMKNRAKVILACNELPGTHDMTKGMLRRLLIVPFDASFEGKTENKGIGDELKFELPGILNRVIEGFIRLRSNQKFSDSKAIEESVDNFRLENDTVLSFYRDMLTVDASDCGTAVSDIYRSYIAYCEDSGIRYTFTKNKFTRELRRCVHDLDARKFRPATGKRGTAYRGVKINSQVQF